MGQAFVFICMLSLVFSGALYAADERLDKMQEGARQPKYISPNDDGVQDVLSFPLKITDKRYVASWNLVIKDSTGRVVRTIGNKEALPTQITFKNIIKHIKDAKKDADVPQDVVWNGRMDNGETAEDGVYTYFVTASDDNGNTSTTEERTVIVDNTPPVVTVKEKDDKVFGAGEKATIYIEQSGSAEDKWIGSIKDDAGKVVRQYEWEGEPVSFEWNGTDEAARLVPDGVYSYSIETADRAGNRSERAALNNIVFSADKSVASISLKGDRFFSPNTKSPKKSVSFDIDIPIPAIKSANRLTDWSVYIADADGKKVYRTWKGKDKPIKSLVYDGTDEDGKVLPDGKYKAVVTAKYLNGYESPAASSPVFILDTSIPKAVIKVSVASSANAGGEAASAKKIFGAGENRTITITPASDPKPLAKVKEWRASIESADRRQKVREWEGVEWLEEVVWDGFGEENKGESVEDGEYVYVLRGEDEAGNYGEEVSEVFILDTTDALIILKADKEAFSPLGPTPSIAFETSAKAGAGGIARYKFTITDFNGKSVYEKEGEGGLSNGFSWDGLETAAIANAEGESGVSSGDGKVCPDGEYVAHIKIENANTSKASADSMPFIIDTLPPYADAEMLVEAFAPGVKGAQKSALVKVKESTKERLWKAEVKRAGEDNSAPCVRRFTWSGNIEDFEWDGTEESGNIAPDGDYTIVLSATDAALNSFSVTLPKVTLDTRDIKGYITAEHEGISPNGDGYLDTQTFTFALTVNDSIISWQADVCDEKGEAVCSWTGGQVNEGNESVPKSIVWDGFISKGGKKKTAGEGTFNCVLRALYKRGSTLVVSSSPFVCTATPPKLNVGIEPKYFSPDNDGVDDDLFLSLGCVTKARVKAWEFKVFDPKDRVFWQTGGTRDAAKKLNWDGLSNAQKDANGMAERVQSAVDYPYMYSVTDDLGMSSTVTGVIPVDVLVIRDGNVLKMAVPSIIFRPDHADFKVESKPGKRDGVTAEQAKNNEKVLGRVADILGKFKDYKITVVGHANRTTENEAEETEDNIKLWGPALIPLSLARAEAVKTYLTKHGVKANRLTTEGKGGTMPVTDWHNKDNNWKNRRVEFILHK